MPGNETKKGIKVRPNLILSGENSFKHVGKIVVYASKLRKKILVSFFEQSENENLTSLSNKTR